MLRISHPFQAPKPIEQAVALCEELAAEFPSESRYREVLVYAYGDLANILHYRFVEYEAAEQAARQAETLSDELVEQSPDAILVHSEGKIILVNSVGLKLFGASESGQLVGRKLADFWHPDVRESLERKIEQSYREGRKISLEESRLIRPDGQMRDVELTGSTFDNQGKRAGEMILRDVTERKRRQAARHEQEA